MPFDADVRSDVHIVEGISDLISVAAGTVHTWRASWYLTRTPGSSHSRSVDMKCSVTVIAMACVVTFSAKVQARIHPYFPYFHVDVLAECVLFKPAAGHILGEHTSYVSVLMICICSESNSFAVGQV